MKKKFLARLTGLVMAFAVAATNVAFADDDVFVSEDESFVSEDETFISEDESVVDEGGSSEPETEGNTEEDNDDDSGMGLGGIADEDAGIDAYAPDIEGDDLFSGMFAEEEVAGLDQSQSLPSSYNGFERGNLPNVRNQGSYGCCWSFAAVGSAEADLIHDGKADKNNIDLSELQVAYFTSHNFTASKKGMDKDTYQFNPSKKIRYYLNNGGNGAFAAGALMNGIGFVGESDLPYTLAGSTTNEEGSIADRYAQSVNSAMLTGAYCASSNDRDTIKRLIMEHGGVNTLIHAPGDEKSARGECFFSEEYNSYITTYREVDHVIMLVGWDDDFSRDKFPDHKPDKDGAWLVRNSWGYNGYGCKGYFWLSYEDSSLADTNAYAYDADTKVYDNCYSYAKAGTRCQFYNYWNSRDRIVTVQNYHIDQGEKILAAGLEFTSPNVTCEILVKGKKGDHTAGKLFKTNLPGYYTVQLECPFEVTDPAGEDVEVTVSYRGNDLRVPIEGPGDYKVVNISVTTQTESDGVTINGEHSKDRDSKVRLFTDNTSSKPGRTKEDVVSTRDKTVKIDKSTGSVQGLDSECELTVDPYGISYDLGSLKPGEDVFSAYELPDWFFPGNENQCFLEDVARAGYDFDGWYEDEDLTKPVTEELLAENKDGYYSKDLTLHPKWKKKQLTLSYQALRSDLSGYDDNTIEIAKLTVDDFTGEGNTYVLPDAAELTGIGEVYGWALDGYGDEAVSSLGMDRAFDLDLVYEDQYYNSHYEQNDTLVIYPQYGNYSVDAKNKPASTETEQKEIAAGEFTAVQADVLDLYDSSSMALIYFKGKTTNAEPYSISLTKGGDFYSVVYDGDDISGMTNGYAVIGIKLNEDISTEKLIREAAKNNKLEFSVKGINSTNAVTCPLTLKTVYKAPKIKLAESSAAFYEGFVTGDTLEATVYETSGLIKEGYDQSGWSADYCQKKGGSYSVVENSSVDVDAGSHSLTISVPKGNYKNGFIRLHGGGWADDAYVYARYDIKLAHAAALELTDKRITLNANNAGANEKVKVSVSSKGGGALPQSVLSTLAVEETDRLFTGLTVDDSSLNKDGSIDVTLGSKPGRNGNCKLYITGELPGGKKQRLALTINVSDKAADKAVRFSAKGSIDALCGGRIFAKPTISGYPGSIVSAVIEPHDGIAMYDAMVDDTGMIVITPGKDFVYNKKGSTETVKLTLDTGAVLSGTLKIKPATGNLSAGGEDRTVKIDPATGGGSAEVPVMAVYSYKYQTSADSYVTKIKMYDIDDFTRLDVAAKQQKGLIVGAVADKGLLRINTTADARPGKTVTVPVTVTEQTTGSKASFKIKVSLTE